MLFVHVYIHISKQREFQKNIYFCFIDYAKAFDCVDHNKPETSERDGNTRLPDLPLKNMEQQTGSKQEKEHVKAVYCHPGYLTYFQSTS